jgi:hypothetical protein
VNLRISPGLTRLGRGAGDLRLKVSAAGSRADGGFAPKAQRRAPPDVLLSLAIAGDAVERVGDTAMPFVQYNTSNGTFYNPHTKMPPMDGILLGKPVAAAQRLQPKFGLCSDRI